MGRAGIVEWLNALLDNLTSRTDLDVEASCRHAGVMGAEQSCMFAIGSALIGNMAQTTQQVVWLL